MEVPEAGICDFLLGFSWFPSSLGVLWFSGIGFPGFFLGFVWVWESSVVFLALDILQLPLVSFGFVWVSGVSIGFLEGFVWVSGAPVFFGCFPAVSWTFLLGWSFHPHLTL